MLRGTSFDCTKEQLEEMICRSGISDIVSFDDDEEVDVFSPTDRLFL